MLTVQVECIPVRPFDCLPCKTLQICNGASAEVRGEHPQKFFTHDPGTGQGRRE